MVVITHTAKLQEPIIKRVIALENQTVDIDFETGTVYVDGQALDEAHILRTASPRSRPTIPIR